MSLRRVLKRYGFGSAETIDDARRLVERLRDRSVEVIDGDLGPGLWGIWLADASCDRIVVSSTMALTPLHRDHVVAHELMHVFLVALPGVDAPETCLLRGEAVAGGVEMAVESLATELMRMLRERQDLSLAATFESVAEDRAWAIRT